MAQETTEGSARLPQPTEEVHLPDPSYLPVVVALGVTLILMGIVLFYGMAALGVVITVIAIVKWIRLTRKEMRELPLEH